MAHWKHAATRCAVEGCESTRRKGWSTCARFDHHARGVSLYGLKPGDPRLTDEQPAGKVDIYGALNAPGGPGKNPVTPD